MSGAYEPETWAEFVIGPREESKTLEAVVRARFHPSRGLMRRLKQHRCALLNGESVPLWRTVSAGDRVSLLVPPASTEAVELEPMALCIVYEDDHLLVVDKPAGLLVHPVKRYRNGTLANGVAHHLQQQGRTPRVHIVNRLDKGTSGLVCFAKHPFVHEQLARQMDEGVFGRRYLAVVTGLVTEESGVINDPIGRDPGHGTRRQVTYDGAEARTLFWVRRRWRGETYSATLLELELQTGRTHQIRVHWAARGHALLGDDLYGGSTACIERPALHAARLWFLHPLSKKTLQLRSKLPADMRNLVQRQGDESMWRD